jgi:hypothetical protein
MKEADQVIEGKIISNQIGAFGKTEFPYGFITIEVSPRHNVVVKIDSYTKHETLDIGSHVVVEAAHLGITDILVARKVSLKVGSEQSSGKDEITAAA